MIFSQDCWIKTSIGTCVSICAQTEFARLKNPIILLGGVHGDEPEGVHLATETLTWLRSEDQTNLVDWVVVPCLNVDGYNKKQRVNANGVDLNRNFPAKDWSPKFDKDRYFPGKSPGTELEVQGLVALVKTLQPRLIIHCHSWEPCIVYTGKRGRRDSERLARSSGYLAKPDIGYATPGSLGQYGWFDTSVPVICIEEQECLVDFAPIWPRFENAMREIFTDRSERIID